MTGGTGGPDGTGGTGGGVEVDRVITCIDCGGKAHLISYPPPERDWEPGDLLTYRCEDCLDRWDLVAPGEDEAGDEGGADYR